ncbi:MAG TPA: hypothetical protein DHV36_03870 [Desulfobacteraceae bacterium]|nr:hypothetical protein [Desulfobacteraceae bacterium]
MSASDNSYTGLLEHFGLNSPPFSSDKQNLLFFRGFCLDINQPLSADQTIVFIHYAFNAAGPDHRIVIEDEAYPEIYRLSQGRVDQIKRIVDRALQRAFENGTQVIGQDDVGDGIIDAAKKGAARKKISKSNKTVFLMIAVGLSIILIGGGLIFWKGQDENVSKPTPEPAVVHPPKKDTTAPKTVAQDKKKSQKAPAVAKKQDLKRQESSAAQKSREQTQYADADLQVLDFLAAYNLEKYEPIFSEAVASETFDTVTRTIYRETGLMLIHSASFPEVIQTRYRILEKLLLNPFQKRFFLFWKPSLKISTYKNGAKGEPIRRLQAMLKKLGLYHSGITGVVDKDLTLAIIRFQRRHFLEPSGFPDVSTLFFITELSD